MSPRSPKAGEEALRGRMREWGYQSGPVSLRAGTRRRGSHGRDTATMRDHREWRATYETSRAADDRITRGRVCRLETRGVIRPTSWRCSGHYGRETVGGRSASRTSTRLAVGFGVGSRRARVRIHPRDGSPVPGGAGIRRVSTVPHFSGGLLSRCIRKPNST